jgi:hypothetical protein
MVNRRRAFISLSASAVIGKANRSVSVTSRLLAKTAFNPMNVLVTSRAC